METAPEKIGESVPEDKVSPVKAGGVAFAVVVKAPNRSSDAVIEDNTLVANFLTSPPPIDQSRKQEFD